jgi:hypothetical protein
MLDPSQMSGIPRPDPQVPAATITVRLIRGALTNRITGSPVELFIPSQPDQPARVEQSDAEGRATFAGLAAATYQARATSDGQTLVSQPIAVQPRPAPGIRVMLVFAKSAAEQQKELGTPDGKARVDTQAAAGTLLFKAVDDGGKPLAGLSAQLVFASRDTEKVESLPAQTTTADGTIHFSGLTASPDRAYMLSVQRDGADQRSVPFQLDSSHGSVLALTVHSVSKNLNALHFGPGSHFIFEPQDDNVQVIENLVLENPTPQPIDPGPAGLRIPLAFGAMSAQTMPGAPANLTIDSSAADEDHPPALLWKGPIPTGQSMLSTGFILKHRGTLSFRQQITLKLEGLRIGVLKLPDLKIDGVTDSEDRKLNGRGFVVASAIVPGIGAPVELTLSGLPADFYVFRIIAALGALGIALSFLRLSIGTSDDSGDEDALGQARQRLMAKREELIGELLQLEQTAGPPPAAKPPGKSAGKGKAKSAAQLRGELEEIYRKLDESEAKEPSLAKADG